MSNPAIPQIRSASAPNPTLVESSLPETTSLASAGALKDCTDFANPTKPDVIKSTDDPIQPLPVETNLIETERLEPGLDLKDNKTTTSLENISTQNVDSSQDIKPVPATTNAGNGVIFAQPTSEPQISEGGNTKKQVNAAYRAKVAALKAKKMELVRKSIQKSVKSEVCPDDDDEMKKLRSQGLTADLIARKKLKMGAPKHLWIAEEDIILADAVAELGEKSWSEIAVLLPGRVGKQCRDRWRNHLCPMVKKGSWADSEDKLLFYYHQELGNQWAEIAKHIPGRTDLSVKNRYYSYLRKISRQMARAAKEKQQFKDQTKYIEKQEVDAESGEPKLLDKPKKIVVNPKLMESLPPNVSVENLKIFKKDCGNRHDPATGFISPELMYAYQKILGGVPSKPPSPLPRYNAPTNSAEQAKVAKARVRKETSAQRKRKSRATGEKRGRGKRGKNLSVDTKGSNGLNMLTSLLSTNHDDALVNAIAGLTEMATPNGKDSKKRASSSKATGKAKKSKSSKGKGKHSKADADLLLGLSQGSSGPSDEESSPIKTEQLESPTNMSGQTNVMPTVTPKNVDATSKEHSKGTDIQKRNFTETKADKK